MSSFCNEITQKNSFDYYLSLIKQFTISDINSHRMLCEIISNRKDMFCVKDEEVTCDLWSFSSSSFSVSISVSSLSSLSSKTSSTARDKTSIYGKLAISWNVIQDTSLRYIIFI